MLYKRLYSGRYKMVIIVDLAKFSPRRELMARGNPQARLRLVDTAADMLRRRGMNATSIRELAKEAQAPLGSTYHYFPGGKSQVVVEAVRYAGEKIAAQLQQALGAGPLEGIQVFIGRWREIILHSEFRAGCTVLAASIEEPANDESTLAADTAAEVYDGWEALLAESFRAHGVSKARAAALAVTVISVTEGAVVLCRAKRNITPLDQVAAQLKILVQANLS